MYLYICALLTMYYVYFTYNVHGVCEIPDQHLDNPALRVLPDQTRDVETKSLKYRQIDIYIYICIDTFFLNSNNCIHSKNHTNFLQNPQIFPSKIHFQFRMWVWWRFRPETNRNSINDMTSTVLLLINVILYNKPAIKHTIKLPMFFAAQLNLQNNSRNVMLYFKSVLLNP